jgi:hypothetical protein
LLQYRVDQDLLQEEVSYAGWLTCWYNHELQRELIVRKPLIRDIRTKGLSMPSCCGNGLRMGGWRFEARVSQKSGDLFCLQLEVSLRIQQGLLFLIVL